MPTIYVAYKPDDLDRIVEILARASRGLEIDREAVHRDLIDLVYAIGRAHDGSDEAQQFHAASADDLSHNALAKLFLALAASDDPLAEAVRHRDLWAGLKRMVRIRWTSSKQRDGRT